MVNRNFVKWFIFFMYLKLMGWFDMFFANKTSLNNCMYSQTELFYGFSPSWTGIPHVLSRYPFLNHCNYKLRLSSFMNSFNMGFQISLYGASKTAHRTIVRFISFMHRCHVPFKSNFLWTSDITNGTRLSFMHIFNMFCQSILSWTTVIANSALVIFVFFLRLPIPHTFPYHPFSNKSNCK